MRAAALAALVLFSACTQARSTPVAVATSVGATSSSKPTTSAATTTITATTATTTPTTPAPRITSTSTTVPIPAVTGSTESTDTLFPDLGNGGYDVRHYTLEVDWNPADKLLTGTTTVEANALAPLASYSLDLAGFTVSQVTVDGAVTPFDRVGDELIITPTKAVSGRFTTTVSYSGEPTFGRDSANRGLGWVSTTKGSYVLAEPGGAHHWFACNDHPSDKATYTIIVTVPESLSAVANGKLVSQTPGRFVYEAVDPMATYLVNVVTGRYVVTQATGPHGLVLTQVDPVDRAERGDFLPITSEMLAYFETLIGPYPLERYGIVLADSIRGVAMESQTLSMFAAGDMDGGRGDDELFLAHELAHQWFGNAVTLGRWQDIWLNESFATYGEWLWSYRNDPARLEAIAETFRRSSASDRRQAGSTGTPKVDSLFGRTVYNGGAVVLHALRKHVGDGVFFSILRTWVDTYSGKSATTQDFVALASQVTGNDLSAFLTTWLESPTLPPFPA